MSKSTIYKSYPAINKELFYLKISLDELKKYYMDHPTQYILYEIMNMKKQVDNLTKHKQTLRKKIVGQFFKKYYTL
jgi:hypothetical protein